MKLAIALVFAASLYHALALPDGAPLDACENLTPQHNLNVNDPRPNPSSSSLNISEFAMEGSGSGSGYTADADEFMYMPGATYSLILSTPTTPITFRGFLVQARTLDGTVVGSFATPPAEGDVKLSNCMPANGGVTHTNNTDKSMVEFTWTAPDVSVGPIRFHYTTVRIFTIFWVNETTAQINGPEVPTVQPTVQPGSASITVMSLWSTLAMALAVILKNVF